MGETSNRVQSFYRSTHFDTLSIKLRKGDREKIKVAAAEQGCSMAEYVCSALTAYGCPVSHTLPDKE